MSNIKLLDQNTINQIAAGEVIDRPASIVKELMENSIDAGADKISVEIKDGGIKLIRITDNGCGIDRDDIKTAFLRHATSKIKSVEDLMVVSSLGFRGEALSSIAAVCQVELITKTQDSFVGCKYTIEGGKEKGLEEIGAPDGTTFLVRNIFFNTPARRKFLKTPQTEAGYISEIVERIALSHPEIAINFINNGQPKLHTPGNGNLKDVIYNIYGREITNNLIEINEECEFAHLKGFIGKPLISKGNRTFENYFVNGRYIKSTILTKAIEEAFAPVMMQHKYPFTVLHLKINSDLLDVNVHPSKMELRFRNGKDLYPWIVEVLSEAIIEKPKIPQVKLTEEKEDIPVAIKVPEPFETKRTDEIERKHDIESDVNKSDNFISEEVNYNKQSDIKQSDSNFKSDITNNSDNINDVNYNIENNTNVIVENKDFLKNNHDNKEISVTIRNKESNQITKEDISLDNTSNLENALIPEEKAVNVKTRFDVPKTSKDMTMNLFEDNFLTDTARKKHKIIGQVFDTYWIVEYEDKMYIIDQHAAHEKVMFEKIMAGLKNKEINTQMVNPPIILNLSMLEAQLLEKFIDNFREIGYEIEEFGGQDFAVRGIPVDLYTLDAREVLMNLIDNLSEQTTKLNSELLTEKIASMSCKAAVKGNNKLSYAEMDSLIDQLLKLENPFNCPHGRPTIISLSKYELEKKFKRII